MTRAEAIYRRLTRLYSKPFRDAYGEEMVRLFRERLERGRAEKARSWRLATAMFFAFLDVIWSAILERASLLRRPNAVWPRHSPRDAAAVRLLRGLRFAVRSLARQPVLVLTVVLTLALGTGATLALFTVANAAVLRPLPYPQPDELVSILQEDSRFGLVPFAVPYLDDLRERTTSFDAIAGFSPSWPLTLRGLGDPRFVVGAFVSQELLELVGIQPTAGRAFREQDLKRGAPPVALVTQAFWERHFGLDVPFSRKVIRLEDDLYTIVGIVPSSLRLPITTSVVNRHDAPAEVLLPWSMNPYAESRAIPVMNVVARLRPDEPLESAKSELRSVGESLRRDFPDTSQSEVTAVLLRDLVTRGSKRTVWMLFGAASFLLLIACANVANLMLARAAERRTEMAIRVSLGAQRQQVVAELFAESFLLALTGTAGGLCLAWSLLELVPALGLTGLPPSAAVELDPRVAAFAVVLATTTSVVFGLVPALRASRPGESGVLRGTRSTKPGRQARNLLVGGEIALALFLLVGAGLLLRSFWNLLQVDPGFRAQGLLQLPLDLGSDSYDSAERRNFLDALLPRLESFPEVSSVGAVNRLPLSGSNVFVGLDVEGLAPRSDGERQPVVDRRVASPGYFRTMGIPILEGRDFGVGDRSDTTPVAVVNRTLARRFWPEGVLGRRLRLQLRSGLGPWLTVVGISGDVQHHGLDVPAESELYVPYAQAPVESLVVVARTASDPLALAGSLRAAVWELDDSIPLDGIGDVSSIVQQSVSEPRFRMLVLNGFAALALVLASVGIYGVTAYTVTSQTRELGLRMALGARAGSVLRLVVGRGVRLAVWGIGLGLAGAILLSRLLDGLLFGVTPTDFATFAAVSLLLFGVAATASYFPARRATRIDPVVALRLD